MAIRYLRSTDGSDADGGTTWALAKATLAGIDAIDTSGDTIWVSQAHSETTAAAVTYAIAGASTTPTKILCGNDAAEPPTALASAAQIATTGNTSSITMNGVSYVYGITFDAGGSGTGTASFSNGGANSTYDTCNFKLSSTGTSSRIILTNIATSVAEFVNCGFRFSAAGQGIQTLGIARIKGGSVLAGGTSPTSLIAAATSGICIIDGFDLSNCSSAVNIVAAGGAAIVKMRDCKLPASWSGALCAGTPSAPIELFNCDSTDTHYRYRKAALFGTIQDETTVVKSSGANDGVTSYSYKMVTNGNAKTPANTLDTPEFVVYNSAVGSSKTATIEYLHDSLTNLKDTEIWAEVMYLGTSGVPLASFADDAATSLVIATGADQDTSSSTWATTGLTNPNKQKCVVTFTPQEEGYLLIKVRMAKASYTVYVDPKVAIA